MAASAAASFSVVPMAPAHLLGAFAVQTTCYPPFYLERLATYEHRVGTHPGGCFVAIDDATRDVVGYVQSFAWCGDALPVCDIDAGEFARVVARARAAGPAAPGVVWHVHDVAAAPAARGRGVGAALMHAALAHATAEGYARAQLIAVMGMERVWGLPQFGFVRGSHPDAAVLGGYAYDGAPAVYMARALGA